MSTHLTLVILSDPKRLLETKVWCQNDHITLDQDYRIFSQLIDLGEETKPTINTLPIPPHMWIEFFTEEGIISTREDKNGKELTFIYAQKLKQLLVPDDSSLKNRAIKAFIDALPDNTPIILYWH